MSLIPVLVAMVFLLGLIIGMYRPAPSALLADRVLPVEWPRAYGPLFWAVNLGFAITLVPGGGHSRGWVTAGCFGSMRSLRVVFGGRIDIRNAAAHLGHSSSGATTLRHYADPNSEVDRRAAVYLRPTHQATTDRPIAIKGFSRGDGQVAYGPTPAFLQLNCTCINGAIVVYPMSDVRLVRTCLI